MNPNILVNLVSRRVRQLTSSGGSTSRPLIPEAATMSAGDIALTEIIEGKLSWEMLEEPAATERAPKRRKRG